MLLSRNSIQQNMLKQLPKISTKSLTVCVFFAGFQDFGGLGLSRRSRGAIFEEGTKKEFKNILDFDQGTSVLGGHFLALPPKCNFCLMVCFDLFPASLLGGLRPQFRRILTSCGAHVRIILLVFLQMLQNCRIATPHKRNCCFGRCWASMLASSSLTF